MSIKRVYHNTMLNSQYLFKNGKAAHFTNGRFATDVASEISELDAEIVNGVPHIYINPTDSQEDTGLQDAIREAQVKATKEAVAAYEAAQKKREAEIAAGTYEEPKEEAPALGTETPLQTESQVLLAGILANRASVASTKTMADAIAKSA